ncbi:aldehyde dehydrogenase family protein [Amycolatopsis mediterranei S699]|uniref:Aldehyde dehydrogenase family protein n=2 Tax=Amycolatopsis mediterranei TaxID=33910 RepID=A0A0H3DCX8_AMYMU|nr:aldehyde dehydrogenase [Amycolatopsis mediterranei]ADJ48571.1 aldehyde dehydrogenase family protein [Amycolatopsis mediterranei U32]AEK45501.1 aldehyde dehydrogenase family protein [Amycolatopsis mediterranei S699]AFO80280.1 aldehyde dehydrogenase family protein [Amycolatopsis mediterranei S699]AGT87408.1 aldehyde dehydrogenase family protein [Amycolatopsis mediterranei RB]KDO11180.1 aldehyde dehydrogenase [Amycolatopsis mediterranei]
MSYDYLALYVDGEWRRPGRGTVAAISPADGERNGSTPLASESDVDAAVAAARRAFGTPSWTGLPVEERAELLERFAIQLEKNVPERATATSVQNGTPISIALPSEGGAPIGLLRYHAGLARRTVVEDRRERFDGMGETIVRREPVGVVAVVVPWNFPQPITMFTVAPALAAGCTVVLKPAPETVFGALELAAAADRAGLPPGVLNVVTGGAEIGEHLVSHPGVDRVAFTGSTAAGRKVGEICGRLLRPVTLELGGKSAAIVLDDADLVATTQGLASCALLNSGQACYLSTRILAPRSRYDEVVDAVAGLAKALKIGDPLDRTTQIGPMVSSRHRERVESYVRLGQRSGARLVAGGVPAEQERGWYVRPTVFADVDNSDPIAREEIFGPVLAVIPYRDVDEAVAIANDSEYGLGGTIWTSDVDEGIAVARRVRSGSVGVNYYDLDLGAPFGGVKASGLGRELGPEGFDTFFHYKSIYLHKAT